jgi:hypothetical protein
MIVIESIKALLPLSQQGDQGYGEDNPPVKDAIVVFSSPRPLRAFITALDTLIGSLRTLVRWHNSGSF